MLNMVDLGGNVSIDQFQSSVGKVDVVFTVHVLHCTAGGKWFLFLESMCRYYFFTVLLQITEFFLLFLYTVYPVDYNSLFYFSYTLDVFL